MNFRRWLIFVLIFLSACTAPAASDSTPTPVAPPGVTPAPSPSALVASPTPFAVEEAPPSSPAGAVERYPNVNDVWGLSLAPDGPLWAATTAGVVRWDLATETLTHDTSADGLPGDLVHEVLAAPSGEVWAATSGGVARFDGAAWKTLRSCEDLPVTGNVHTIAFAPGGGAWIVGPFAVHHVEGDIWTSYELLTGDLAIGPGGRVWVVRPGIGEDEDGVLFFEDGTWQELTTGDQVGQITVAAEGDLWGTVYLPDVNGQRLVRFQEGAWVPVEPGPELDGYAFDFVRLFPDGVRGGLWVALPGTLFYVEGERWTPVWPAGGARCAEPAPCPRRLALDGDLSRARSLGRGRAPFA